MASGLLFGLALLAMVYLLGVYQTLAERAGRENRQANQAQAELAGRFIADHQQRLLGLVTIIASRQSLKTALDAGDASTVASFLRPLMELGGEVAAAFVADRSGRLLAALSPNGMAQPGQVMPWPPQAGPWISGVIKHTGWDAGPLVLAAAPVEGPDGKAAAYLGSAQRVSYWRDFFNQLAARPGRVYYLFDAAGDLVAEGLERANLPAPDLLALARRVCRQAHVQKPPHPSLQPLPSGEAEAFTAAVVVAPAGWTVVVLQEYDAAMASTRALFQTLLVFSSLLFLCLFFLVFLLLTRQLRQERKLFDLDDEARHLESLVAERTADLAASTARYRGLVEDLPDIVYELDGRGCFSFVSRAVTSVLGYQPGELIGRTHRELILPEDQVKYDGQRAAAVGDQLMSITALRHRAADGRARWLSIHSRGGLSGGRRGVARDVTDQVLAEQRVHELSRQLIYAQEEERKRLALDLHDEMGQLLSALKIGLQTQAKKSDNRDEMDRLIRLTQKVMDRSRALAYNLRPAILDSFGLAAAITDMCESLAESDIFQVDCRLEQLDETRLGPQVKTTLFRFVQEALTNAVKHSGSTRGTVELAVRGDFLHLCVRDQGGGFDVDDALTPAPGRRRLGLLGMRERLGLIGGRLTIQSTPEGSALTAEVPMGGLT